MATIWEISSGEPQELLRLVGHRSGINDVDFSPDGSRLATASFDLTARVWDLADGQELLSLSLHTNFLTSVAFSPDGKRLVTTGADGTTRLYALDLDELVALARQRVTRSLTDDECRRYLHLDACPP